MEAAHLVVLFRCGKHASVVWEAVARNYPGAELVVWDESPTVHSSFLGRAQHVTDAQAAVFVLRTLQPRTVHCFVCIGSPSKREELRQEVSGLFDGPLDVCDLQFPYAIHDRAYVSPSASVARGCFIGVSAVVHTHARVGEFCVVNTLAVVEHDCCVGDYATLGPGALACGSVRLGARVLVGAGATLRDNIAVARDVMIGMGAAVVRSIATPGTVWVGVPARQRAEPE